MEIRNMLASDWNAVSKIYAEGIATGFATFEKEIPSYQNWDKAHLNSCRIVLHSQHIIKGWAALSPVSSRCVYGGVAEVSVYVGKKYFGQGVGHLLLKHLISDSEKQGFWTLQSGIFPKNKASIALHKKAGFRFIGTRKRVGKLNGVWKDNLLFEKRSETVGID